jgi:hypothetical protein
MRRMFAALAAIALVFGVAACSATDDNSTKANADTSVSAPATPSDTPTYDHKSDPTNDPGDITDGDPVDPPGETSAPSKPKPKPKPKPSLTLSQEQAIGSAEDYLDLTAFSRRGLIKQLSSEYGEGFSVKDATFAVDHIKVNWNEQAAKSAKDYLETSHFSRNGLIEQLESEYGEQFTHAQAVYGVDKAGL